MTSAPIESDKATGPRSRKGTKSRSRLLAAAKEIFEETGFLDSRISDIAERAGLSHGSFYHYFESKEEIFREVAAGVDKELRAPLEDVILDPTSDASPRERIREAIRLYMESYRREARITGVIEQVSRYDDRVRAARAEMHRSSGAQVEEAIRQLQRHDLADAELDPVIAAAVLGAMTRRFPEAWFVDGMLDCSFEEGVEQLTRVFINGLGLKEAANTRRVRRARRLPT